MRIPGFTAEASLNRTDAAHPGHALLHLVDQLTYPAQWRWPILEPNCVRICLPWWGGYCHWICY
ncbi:MAG TPA: hypothetical protein VFU37_20780 [Pyrinomonadaceae bacterium]|nr:hypothetical protein [Pyrinomonadaceae bacterium]